MAAPVMRTTVEAEGTAAVLAALRGLPKEASAALREESMQLSTLLASKAASAATAEGRQGTLLAPTVKPRRDRVISVQAGGTTRVGRNRVPAYRLLFGSEFGSDQYKQFGKPHRGREGYWLFPQVTENSAALAAAWNAAADRVVKAFTKGG